MSLARARAHDERRATRSRPRPWRRALAWLAFLGPFFFRDLRPRELGWRRSARTLPSLVFEWERAIPFWAWTIVPYWSIDLLYGLSLFVCAHARELDTHAKRLLTAQVVAVACFVAVAAALLVRRARQPTASFGALFDVLAGFDQPFNQVPVAAHRAGRHPLGAVRAHGCAAWRASCVDAWFVLIGASVLTTYQHHFIDIPTGFALGWLCLWLWPLPDSGARRPPPRWRWTRDPRVAAWRCSTRSARRLSRRSRLAGRRLGAVAAVGRAVARARRACYAGFGAGGIPERRRRPPVASPSRWLLAPYLAGAWINSRLVDARAPQPVPRRRRRVDRPRARRARLAGSTFRRRRRPHRRVRTAARRRARSPSCPCST